MEKEMKRETEICVNDKAPQERKMIGKGKERG